MRKGKNDRGLKGFSFHGQLQTEGMLRRSIVLEKQRGNERVSKKEQERERERLA